MADVLSRGRILPHLRLGERQRDRPKGGSAGEGRKAGNKGCVSVQHLLPALNFPAGRCKWLAFLYAGSNVAGMQEQPACKPGNKMEAAVHSCKRFKNIHHLPDGIKGIIAPFQCNRPSSRNEKYLSPPMIIKSCISKPTILHASSSLSQVILSVSDGSGFPLGWL